MNFREYIANNEKKFKFQIKTLFPIEETEMDMLEKALFKYRPALISKAKKTMFQSNPLGFTGAKNSEVYIIDVELTVPVTPLLLQHDLRDAMRLHKDSKELKVFGEHSEELEAQMNPFGDPEEKKPALLTNEKYEEVEEAKFEDNFGDAYNAKFLAYLKKVEAERAEQSGRGAKVDAKHSITKWADQPTAEPSTEDTEQKK